MRDEAVIVLLLVLAIASAGAGYFVGNNSRQSVTTTATSMLTTSTTATSLLVTTATTTATQAMTNVASVEIRVIVYREPFLSCGNSTGAYGCYTSLSISGGFCNNGYCHANVTAGTGVVLTVEITFVSPGCQYPDFYGSQISADPSNVYCLNSGVATLYFSMNNLSQGVTEAQMDFKSLPGH